MQSRVIGVLGASGGIGASTLAAGMAVRADVAGWATASVDGDRFGGGLDVLFGLDTAPGLRWPDLAAVDGEVDGAKLGAELPWFEDVAVLSFDRSRLADPAPDAVDEVVAALARCHDVVLIGLPRPGDALFPTFAGLCQDVVVVAGTSVPALAGAAALEPVVAELAANPWLAVRSAGKAGAADGIAETMSHALGMPLLAVLPEDRGLDADLAHGIPPGDAGRVRYQRALDAALAQLLTGVPATRRRTA